MHEVVHSQRTNKSINPPLYFNNATVKLMNAENHLGLQLDNKLSFNKYSNNKISKPTKGIWGWKVIFSLFKYAGTYCSFINHKSFIQPYLSYGNVIYDQPANASFSNRTDSVQCNMALAIKRAIKDSPCDKLHQELELKYLYKKRCVNRLCLLDKFLSNKQSSHIQKQSPEVFFKKRCS